MKNDDFDKLNLTPAELDSLVGGEVKKDCISCAWCDCQEATVTGFQLGMMINVSKGNIPNVSY